MSNLVARQNMAYEKYKCIVKFNSLNSNWSTGSPIISDNEVFFSPFAHSFIRKFTPETSIDVNVGSVLASGSKYWGGCHHSNGSEYFLPHNNPDGNRILKYTKATSISEYVGSNLSLNTGLNTDFYRGMVEHPSNNKIYLTPTGKRRIVELDTVLNTTTEVGITYTSSFFVSYGVVVHGDWIYLVPWDSPQISRYNVITQVTENIATPFVGNLKLAGGVALGSKIYFTCRLNNHIVIYDTNTNINTYVTSGILTNGNTNPVAHPNGKIYFYGNNYNSGNETSVVTNGRWYEFNPNNNELKIVGNFFNINVTGIALFGNNIIGTGNRSTSILTLLNII